MKKIVSLLLVAVIAFGLFACSKSTTDNGETTQATTTATQTTINVLGLKGPTGMGMAKLISDSKSGKYTDTYNFSIIADPTMIASSLSSGEADIAACPLNMASVLYNKMNGNIRMLAINTLGTLYILDKTGTVNSIEDLKGKTIVTAGQGATPEYALNYLLDTCGISGEVNIEYKSEHSEVATAILSGKADIVMLPEPNVSVVTAKNSDIKIAIDVAKTIEEKNGLQFAMGCIVVKKDFLEKNTEAVKAFMKNYEESISFVNSSDEAGKYICDAGILDNEAIAQKSIKTSSITYIAGEEMKKIATDNFNLLFDANPKSIGGKYPNDDIYFVG